MPDLIVTSWATAIMAIWMLFQVNSIIRLRISEKVVYGDAGNKSLIKRIRGHGNNTEQVPIFLIALGLVESQGMAPFGVLAIIAALFVAGRISHGLYFLNIGMHYLYRTIGMISTQISQLAIVLALVFGLLTL